MRKDDWTGLGVSLGVHALLLLLVGVALIGAKKEPPPIRLVQLEIGPLPAPQSAARPAAQGERPAPQQPETAPEPRPQPPASPSPRLAETRTPSPQRLPEPRETEATTVSPPDPAPEPQPTASGGTPTGDQGSSSDPRGTDGAGNTGSSGLSIEGLGSRAASCPRPSYPGVNGTVTYAVVFAPDGRYVSARPLRRGGDARIDQAVRRIIGSCRAQALPGAADQVNQEGRITFRFTGG